MNNHKEAHKQYCNEYWNKPCATAGLTSYRYKGRYGYIMVGATDHNDALKEVLRSTDIASMHNLEVWDMLEGCYVPTVRIG